MNEIHLIMQGKGGVGKTFVSSMIAQYKLSKAEENKPVLIDTDPVNATFASYESLDVNAIDIMKEGRVDQGQFDNLIEIFLNTESDVVVDNGASTFLPLKQYLEQNNVLETLIDAEKRVIIHTIVTGGQALNDTLHGLKELLQTTDQGIELYVWKNEYFGPIVSEDDVQFEQLQVYKDNEARLAGIISIPKKSEDTFGKDIGQMLRNKMTFEDCMADPKVRFMQKKRLTMTKENLFNQMDVTRV